MMHMNILFPRVLGALLVVGVVGCGGGFQMEAPSNFVALEEEEASGYDFRATNARGVVIAVRSMDNDPEGSADFWLEAIRNRIRLNGGYALQEEVSVRAKTGQEGTQLRFGRDQNGTPFRYWVTVFVGEETLHVVEAGGRAEHFEAAVDDIVATVEALEIP